MSHVSEVDVAPLGLARLTHVAPAVQLRELQVMVDVLRLSLEGRVIWNVSSTAAGGGVAEMLYRLVGYGAAQASFARGAR